MQKGNIKPLHLHPKKDVLWGVRIGSKTAPELVGGNGRRKGSSK